MQHNYKIKLNNVDDVKRLNTILCTIPCEFDINIGKGAIDAKSIMGLMALDISKPLVLTAVCNDNILISNINEKSKILQYKTERSYIFFIKKDTP